MISKTERFELRLESSTVKRLDQWRAEQGDLLSRSEAARRLIDLGFSDSTKKEFKLDDTQKLIVWLLTELLKHPDKREADQATIQLIQKSIYGGHFWALKWEMTGVLHSHVDRPEDVAFVVDVLDMWSFIETGYANCPDEKKQEIKSATKHTSDPQFIGFDGNHEGAFLAIARFLTKDMGRFSDFADRSLNSHREMVSRYRQMLELFEPMRASLTLRRELSVPQLIQMLKRS